MNVDIETRNLRDDLTECGAYRYAQHAELLLFGYSFADETPTVIDVAGGQAIPQRVLNALFDSSVKKHAWNAPFEIAVLSAHFETQLPAEQWHCTMALAYQHGLPGALFEAGVALGVDKEKDSTGKALINYFCRPCKPTKTNGGRTFNKPEHDPVKWAQFKAYCARDVEAEREILRRLHG